MITDAINKERVAIVTVGYNRLKSMSRLLNSLLAAEYPSNDIPLVISIDCSGDEELYSYVKNFEWPYGEKYVNIQKERLGLKHHIFQCGDLTKNFKGIILLEDDIYVSPYFYNYAIESLVAYGDDDRIAEISLYTNETNGYVGFPLAFIKNANDTFLMQDVSTWGECWTEKMWNSFCDWKDSHSEEDIQAASMPINIKKWTKAWSKPYNAYVVSTGKYVVYPSISVTTNFSDAGVHGGDNNSLVQVNLLVGPKKYDMQPYEKLVKYDIYFNNTDIYQWLNIEPKDLCLDIYGYHVNDEHKRYVLSCKKMNCKVVKSFALSMRPAELNIKYNIPGNGLFLYDTEGKDVGKSKSYPLDFVEYFLQGFTHKYLVQATIRYYWSRLMARIK